MQKESRMMDKKRYYILTQVLTACLLLTALLTACGDSPTATSTRGGQTNPTGSATLDPTVQAILTAAPTPGAPAKLVDSTLPVVKNGTAKVIGPVDETAALTFDVALKLDPAKQAELEKAITAASDPNNKDGGKYINNDQFLQKYAPTEEQVRAIQAYMAKNGISLQSISANRMSATFRAPAKLLQDTFKVKINRYSITRAATSKAPVTGPTSGPNATPNDAPPQESEPQAPPANNSATTPAGGGKTETVEFYANDSDLTIPQNYLPYIQSVNLNNFPVLSGSFHPAQSSGRFQGYSPNQIKAAYNIASLAKAGLDGSGQSIAVFGYGGFKQSDLDTYAKTFNLPAPQIEIIRVAGADDKVGDSGGEVELDLEVIMGIAPKAKILYYEAPNQSNLRFMAETLNTIVAENRAKVVSVSYGGCELTLSPSSLQAVHQIFAQGRAEGMTFFISSGDSGAYGCAQFDDSLAATPAIAYAAADPYVTSVGGTALVIKNGQYGGEIAWSSTEEDSPTGTGGGISTFFSMPGFQTKYNVKQSNPKGQRQVPDVSANADPRTGFANYCTISRDICGALGWHPVGGTSASAPLWTAGTALINQYLDSKFPGADARLIGPDYFYLLQDAYSSGVIKYAPYRDITQGDNLYYKATQGFDLATGLGTPDFLNISLDIEQLYRQAAGG